MEIRDNNWHPTDLDGDRLQVFSLCGRDVEVEGDGEDEGNDSAHGVARPARCTQLK